ncbi:DMT family transporter [Alkalihalobacillus sp. CinArs1]|uniref:DMT family transporter n=1 Tax=Alkalihalobacillus sp. CinArs1 TaxID=2995314 RepID=UPI0022DCEE9C|nr:multidrug efflux SMR transporter [Alkalihalobacillus sp. CinArs1]
MMFLTISLICSVLGSISVKLSKGFKKHIPSVMSFLLFGFCIYFLTLAVQTIDVGIAYAVWSGVSIAGTTLAGILLFNEKANKRKFLSIAVIIAGVVIL